MRKTKITKSPITNSRLFNMTYTSEIVAAISIISMITRVAQCMQVIIPFAGFNLIQLSMTFEINRNIKAEIYGPVSVKHKGAKEYAPQYNDMLSGLLIDQLVLLIGIRILSRKSKHLHTSDDSIIP